MTASLKNIYTLISLKDGDTLNLSYTLKQLFNPLSCPGIFPHPISIHLYFILPQKIVLLLTSQGKHKLEPFYSPYAPISTCSIHGIHPYL